MRLCFQRMTSCFRRSSGRAWIASAGTKPSQGEGTNMKTPHLFGLTAAVVFVISHALPAYGDGSGFACFRVTLEMLFGRDTKFLSGGWFYYSGFALSNILFPVLVAALFLTRKNRRIRTLVSVVLLLHVLSWLILNAAQ